ncbi:hypothetical protein OR235_001321 [Enterobacter cloacae]|nr:hypothetical protein [Enterobacter cloacae]
MGLIYTHMLLTNLPGKIYEGECQELETQMEWTQFNPTKQGQQHWANRSWYYEKYNTPTFFPDPYNAGMHEELHRAIKNDIGKIQEPWQGSAEDLFMRLAVI